MHVDINVKGIKCKNSSTHSETELFWELRKAKHQQRVAAIHTAESLWTFMDPGCKFLLGGMFDFIAPCGPLLEEEKVMGVLCEADAEVWGERMLRHCAPQRLRSCLVTLAVIAGFQWEDGHKGGHFTIAIVFKSDHLSLAIQRRYLPQGPTYINQSDKKRRTDSLSISEAPVWP